MNISNKINNGKYLFDGAMGTYYIDKFGHRPEFCELACLTHPKRISQIHNEYINAGCDAIKTNTFSANTRSLNRDINTVMQIIDRAYDIAEKCGAKNKITVFADIGPIPFRKGESRLPEYFQIVDKFIEKGAKNFIFETFPSTRHLGYITEHIKGQIPDAFIICSFAVSPDGYTREGISTSKLIFEMENCKHVDAYGFNCVSGPHHMIDLVNSTVNATKPICAMPNAGYPTVIGNRMYFEKNIDYYANGVTEMLKNGASIVGGCCGTTPEYIHAIRTRLNNGEEISHSTNNIPNNWTQETLTNRFWEKVEKGKKVIAVELDPPQNSDITKFMNGAKVLKDIGTDAITIADCPVSRARASSSILACKLLNEFDMDVIPHMTCRDRNVIATKALLLGLNAEGINNVLVVTGDPVPAPDRNQIKSVFNFNSVVLSNFIKQLDSELMRGPFKVFGALNVNAKNFDYQLKHAKHKLEAGADGLLTQPIHSPLALENLKRARNELDCKILGGIMPIVSYRNACFMNNEIAGISVSEDIVEMYRDIDKDEATKLAVSISSDIAEKIFSYVDGYYLITPFMRTDIIAKLIENINKFE